MIVRGSVFSKALEMDTGITAVISDDFEIGRPYQVAYLLHGLCGSNGNFADNTMLPVYVNKYHCICILPEVSRSFYTDMRYGQKFFTYITEELPLISQSLFHISAKRQDTAVIGVSMGGYGALKCALTKPAQYGACCALSPGCLFLKDFLESHRLYGDTPEFRATWGEQFITDFKAIFGENLEWKAEYELLDLAKRLPGKTDAPRLYMCCGDGDGLLQINRQFRDALQPLDISLIYEEWRGTHNWYFFNEALQKALQFCFGDNEIAHYGK